MNKTLLLFVSLFSIIEIHSQEIDMSQVSFNLNDRTKPYLAKEIVDTIGTCLAVKAELYNIASKGINAFIGNESGKHLFADDFEDSINEEKNKLINKYQFDIDKVVESKVEDEYQRILSFFEPPKEESFQLLHKHIENFSSLRYKLKNREQVLRIKEQTDKSDIKTYLSDINKLQTYLYNLVVKYVNNSGNLNIKKASKSLVKDLDKNKGEIITYLKPIFKEYVMIEREEESYQQALSNVFDRYINDVIQKIPSTNDTKCYDYIHGASAIKTPFYIESPTCVIPKSYFLNIETLRKDKMKVITWKNPNFSEADMKWNWLSEKIRPGTMELADDWKEVETHFPIADFYYTNSNHPNYKVRMMEIKTRNTDNDIYGFNVAFSNDTLVAVADNFKDAGDLILVMSLYELEHNRYNINSYPPYVKDCIRSRLIRWHNYRNFHKYETEKLADEYIKQLEDDLPSIRKRRTVRVDGTTFRHYIGENDQIVILQKFVYGHYIYELFPYKKVTTFNPKHYKTSNRDKEDKVLTCYYIVEKFGEY